MLVCFLFVAVSCAACGNAVSNEERDADVLKNENTNDYGFVLEKIKSE